MKIAFHGAARTVTGSKHLLTLESGFRILLDCGMFQGIGRNTDLYNRDFGFDPAEVSVMILSHAHIDHSGLIPRLIKQGFKGKIFCTDATKDLTSLLLHDSAEIQESDSRQHNKYSKATAAPLYQPLYTSDDVAKALPHLSPQPYDQWFSAGDGVEVMFTDAGHIIGSASVHLRITENGKRTALSFSGDVGRYRDAILRSPGSIPPADYIVLESTYGNSLHEEIVSSIDTLLSWIEKICVERKGKLVLPAFSLGRTQELLYALNQLELENRLPKVAVFLDSPLSTSITEVVQRYPSYFNPGIQKIMQIDQDPFYFEGLHYIKSVEESKRLNYRNEPCVIISASGMAEAGRVKHHISNTIENGRNGIVMTGYCEPHSLGGKLIAGADEVSIFGVYHQVNAEIGSIRSMSAHGDYEDLIYWLGSESKPQLKNLFLVHGEYEVQQAFKHRLETRGFAGVEIPDRHSEYEL